MLDREIDVNFGTSEVCSYKKHKFHAKGIIYSFNTKAFVTWNEKQIHMWSELTAKPIFKVNFYEETKSHSIASVCYSPVKMLYFVISTDFKMHVFNENMIHI